MIYALGHSVPSERYQKSLYLKRSAIFNALILFWLEGSLFPYFQPCLVACVFGRAMIGRRTRFFFIIAKAILPITSDGFGYDAPERANRGV